MKILTVFYTNDLGQPWDHLVHLSGRNRITWLKHEGSTPPCLHNQSMSLFTPLVELEHLTPFHLCGMNFTCSLSSYTLNFPLCDEMVSSLLQREPPVLPQKSSEHSSHKPASAPIMYATFSSADLSTSLITEVGPFLIVLSSIPRKCLETQRKYGALHHWSVPDIHCLNLINSASLWGFFLTLGTGKHRVGSTWRECICTLSISIVIKLKREVETVDKMVLYYESCIPDVMQ